MIKDYSTKQRKEFIKETEKKTLLNRIMEKPIFYGAIAGGIAAFVIATGATFYSAKTIKPYVDKAAYQIKQEASHERAFDKFVYDSGAQRR